MADPGEGARLGVHEGSAQDLFGPEVGLLLQRYIDILSSRGIDWGLVGPRERPRLFERHILNSLAVLELLPQGSQVVDVGSGAGLPGIPLAIARPDLRFILVDSVLRRTSFLEEAVEELGLTSRVSVLRARAEQLEVSADVVVARAVAPLARLVAWTAPLFGTTGELIALKGSSASDEVAAAAPLLKRLGLRAEVLVVRALPQAEPTHAVRVRHG